ncbi:MAG: DUF488 domain-containing protein [bacterium]|nr:DUF488 domain-containing protein [bacterium]
MGLEICTIGFTKPHNAASFFGALREEGVKRLLDVRLNNSSQLAGFAKRDDLAFFLRVICGAEYVHEPDLLAPTQELLKGYQNKELSWSEYEEQFLALMACRRIETQLSPDMFGKRTALLCSEHTAERCHRRLVVEYLDRHWGGVVAIHLPRGAIEA